MNEFLVGLDLYIVGVEVEYKIEVNKFFWN